MNEHAGEPSSGGDGVEAEQALHDPHTRSFKRKISVPEQPTGKNIKASKSVLSMYHDSLLYGEVPFTIKVRTALRSWPLRPLLMWMEFIAAITSVIIYILCSYQEDPSHRDRGQRRAELACSLFFVLDFILNVYSAPVRLYYIFSIRGVIDFVCTTPILLYWTSSADNGASAILLFFRAARILPLVAHVGAMTGGAIREQIFVLAMYTFGVVFVGAGVLQWVDNKMTTDSAKQALGCPRGGCLSFFEAFWFMIVTMSTVGYGDVTPRSDSGRALVLCVIVGALLILPPQINRILHLASRRPYGGAFEVRKVVGSRFVIISGNLSFRTVQDFLSEFYHPSRDKDMWAFPLRMVIMAPFKPSFELKTLLMRYKGRVEFIQGTPLKDSDLDRVGAKMASAVYLLAESNAKDREAEDTAQIVRTLAVHRHCGSKVRVIVELLQPEKAAGAIWDDTEQGIEIMCLDLTRFKLLARSCHVRGLSTFIVNLFRSGLDLTKPMQDHWMSKYMHGLHHAVFPVLLPPLFIDQHLTFEQAAELIYRMFNAILFGADIARADTRDEHRDVVLFPRGRVLRSSDVGLVIAKDLQTAHKISMLHPPPTMAPREHVRALLSVKMRKPSDEHTIAVLPVSEPDVGVEPKVEAGEMAEVSAVWRDMSTKGEKRGGAQHRYRHRQRHRRGSSPDESDADADMGIGLEDAVDRAMRWPPVRERGEKPDPAILERRAAEIADNLRRRTVSVVALPGPHVLVCIPGAWPGSLFHFVSLLRAPGMPHPPVAILHPLSPRASQWGAVGFFDHVYFVLGSPAFELDLVRAGALQALKVVILHGAPGDQWCGDRATDADPLVASHLSLGDVNNVFIAATVERLLRPHKDRVIVEVQQEEMQYLQPRLLFDRRIFDSEMYRRNRSAAFQFAPPYIDGKAFCPTLRFLMYASFYNCQTMAIVDQLICGGEVETDETTSDVLGRQLEQIPAPKPYVGGTFHELFVGLLRHHGALALGLFRTTGANPKTQSQPQSPGLAFVYTNPIPADVVEPTDFVYILR